MKVLFALAILVCCGVHTYAHCSTRSYNVVVASPGNQDNNIFSADIDAFDDDQIYQTITAESYPLEKDQVLASPDCQITNKHCLSIWLPPDIA